MLVKYAATSIAPVSIRPALLNSCIKRTPDDPASENMISPAAATETYAMNVARDHQAKNKKPIVEKKNNAMVESEMMEKNVHDDVEILEETT